MTRALHYSCPYCSRTIALVAVLTGRCVHCRRELDPELLATMRLRYDQGHDMPAEDMTPDQPPLPPTVAAGGQWHPPVTWDDDEQDRPAPAHTVAYLAMVVSTLALLLAVLALSAWLQLAGR